MLTNSSQPTVSPPFQRSRQCDGLSHAAANLFNPGGDKTARFSPVLIVKPVMAVPHPAPPSRGEREKGLLPWQAEQEPARRQAPLRDPPKGCAKDFV